MFQISLSIPIDKQIPIELSRFSPDENFLMIEIGLNAILKIKSEFIEHSHKELKTQIEHEINEKARMEIFKMEVINTYKIDDFQSKIDENRLIADQLVRDLENAKKANESISYNHAIQLLNIENDFSKQLQDDKNRAQIENIELKQEKQRLEDHFENQLHRKTEQNMKVHNENRGVLQSQYDKLQSEFIKYKEASIKRELEHEKKEKEKYGRTIEELNQKMSELKKKTPKIIGNEGEKILEELLMKTFADFEDFELANMSKKAHMGDFHLKFRHFNILVDCKKYTGGVHVENRDKLMADLKKNSHITKIAWMVSLDSPNDKFNKAPYMFSVKDGLCICYINSLILQGEPAELLKTVWYSCKVLYDMVLNINNSETTELGNLRKNEARIKTHITGMLKTSKTSFFILNQMRENLEIQEKEIKELVDDSIENIQQIHHNMVVEWWEQNIKPAENGLIKSNKIYDKFKQDNPEIEFRINNDMFKMILCSFIENDNVIKPKSAGSQLQIKNYGF